MFTHEFNKCYLKSVMPDTVEVCKRANTSGKTD